VDPAARGRLNHLPRLRGLDASIRRGIDDASLLCFQDDTNERNQERPLALTPHLGQTHSWNRIHGALEWA